MSASYIVHNRIPLDCYNYIVGGEQLDCLGPILCDIVAAEGGDIAHGPDGVVGFYLIASHFDFASGTTFYCEGYKYFIFNCVGNGVFLRRANHCVHNIELNFEEVVGEKVVVEESVDGRLVVADPVG